MSTIDSLDLATLTNNPANIADALEDVLTATNSTITQLKEDAQDLKDEISALKTSAQADHDAIETLLGTLGDPEYHYFSSVDNSWISRAITDNDDHDGIVMQRWGKLYIASVSINKDVGTGQLTQTLLTSSTTSGNITYPSNDIRMGVQNYGDGGQTENIGNLIFNTSGELIVKGYNSSGSMFYIGGNFIGLDV